MQDTGWTIEESVLDSRYGQEIFLRKVHTDSGASVLYNWYWGLFLRGVKRKMPEADHSPPTNTKGKNAEAVPPLPQSSSWRCVYLIQSRDNFVFTL